MVWEYKTIKYKTTGFWVGGDIEENELNNEINYLGSQGWELIIGFDTSNASGQSRYIVLIFKRARD